MSYGTYKLVQATTASAMTVEDWEKAWKVVAPVIVAAGRFVDAEREGNSALIEDAHMQLLRALCDYKAAAAGEEDAANGRNAGSARCRQHRPPRC